MIGWLKSFPQLWLVNLNCSQLWLVSCKTVLSCDWTVWTVLNCDCWVWIVLNCDWSVVKLFSIVIGQFELFSKVISHLSTQMAGSPFWLVGSFVLVAHGIVSQSVWHWKKTIFPKMTKIHLAAIFYFNNNFFCIKTINLLF